ncbi:MULTISPECIES: HD-GYP domain-containing protein [Clostridium]|jgi:polar amino acid transport system substrate-binding protein|uniref:Cyclic di-GMP phosphodiesterase response regulator RpfG n=1 Tax=Clostridium saccharoperbutylacetonicum N1-4(HMT) TaxID=931276 RepID=M1MNK2_9CLOT|nr:MULTISPECIES: HD-GYP domain-containing protein [Clostridium]AGF56291.1 cyclic di-GMP phosphodiesterase response regulator RpfG [Clostridium saccharoperbutylacetonicum N1-4(HMT)]AQR95031.1 cyclic di-GMP phosphodiesterase response regulator RpfG [Clostridium saccharoperbutylacetonicum]NRT62965.1 polar amino acid transport system substrate-binding protein [Clostridium saccharoperbutylacetonicum]NSB26322.1 polar amino acid transport system substrate-binding protein [Clostridium saccharoperbutyla
MKEIAEELSVFFNYSDNVSYENDDVNYSKIVNVFDSFENMHKMSKDDFLEKIFVGAFKLIPEAQKGSFFELVEDKYVPIFCNGYDMDVLRKLEFKREDAFIEYQCSDVSSIEAYEIYIERRDDSKYSEEMINIFKSLGTYNSYTSLYAPIQVEGVNVGIICFECFDKKSFSKDSKKVLKFYAQIISNFYAMKTFHEKEKKMYDDIVTALVSAIEVNDKYTEGHAKRVREYSCAIAEELELPKVKINDISTAALLHDIGKIGISTEILNKPGKLTEEEYGIIKQHPVYTKTILEKIRGFSTITNFAYNHHENYDGSGYPRGLKNNEIPLEAQIIQVADAYDAMTSERAYRKALSTEDALNIIKKEMGKQFNPEIAKVAIKIFSK